MNSKSAPFHDLHVQTTRGNDMSAKSGKRNILQRILGLPATPKPANPQCWSYAQGLLSIDLALAPELASPGGALRFEGSGLPKRILVFMADDEKYYALHNRCTHLGHRRLDPVPEENKVQCCSVGQSSYDLQGNNLSGPARHPIQTYDVRVENNSLLIEVS